MANFPSIDFTNMVMRSFNPTRITTTINGIEQRSSIGAQYYGLTVNFQNLTQSEQRQLLGFIDEMAGPLTEFEITLPDYLGDSTGTYSGTITTNGTASEGVSSVPVTTSASSGVTILKAGDLVRFAGHTKVYSVKSNIVTTSGGAATILLTQQLRSSVSGSTTVTHKNLTMNVRFADITAEFEIDPSLYPSFDLDFVEVL